MSHKKPEPIVQGRQPNICPVCGKASYSAAGIHPQCSVQKAELERVNDLKERAKTESKKTKVSKTSQKTRWQKSCPKCHTNLHVRKKECECGYKFADT